MSEGGAVELSWYLGALDRLQLEHLVVKMIVKDDSNFDLLTEVRLTETRLDIHHLHC